MTTTIQITPDRVVFSGGKFDSDFLYIRSAPVGEFRLPLNFTMEVSFFGTGTFRQYAQFNYSSNTYTHRHYGDAGQNPPQLGFTPITTWVKFT